MTRPGLCIAAALTALALAGCTDPDMADLYRFVGHESAPAAKDPTPAATETDQVPLAYGTTLSRSPFEPATEVPTAGGTSIGPDPTRVRQPIERFALERLEMVGTLAGRGAFHALVRDPDGYIHQLATGDYLGRDHGRITAVRDTGVDIVELVVDGSGRWRRRPRSIALNTPAEPGEPNETAADIETGEPH